MTREADQERAPIYETLAGYSRTGIYGFHTPGHKGGRFAAPEIAELVGKSGLALDLPAMTATDNTFHPSGPIGDAQQLAAELFGAQATFFLSAGSTLGVAASLLAAAMGRATPNCSADLGGALVLAMPRNIHRSVVAGLVLSGAVPRFIPHEVLPECGALGVTAEALTATLDVEPRPAAVLLTRPSYYGLARDLGDVAAVCHERGVPLVVDEAHGAHLHLLPKVDESRRDSKVRGSERRDHFPDSAMAAGADIAVQSCHKTLGSLVGSAQLHVGHDSLIDPARVQDALNFLQTTSPSFLLLASLDVMRRWMNREGRELFATAVAEARALEDEIDRLPGLSVFRPERDARLADHRRDPLRLVVNVSGTGWSGFDVELHLRDKFQIEDEMADLTNVVYVLSPRDDAAARERLLAGLRDVSERGAASKERGEPSGSLLLAPSSALMQSPVPPLAMAPRQAALSAKTRISLDEAAGRTCAEMVMFYPPGIPLLMPGETVTGETIEVCRQLLAAGAHPYASDSSLKTVYVVE